MPDCTYTSCPMTRDTFSFTMIPGILAYTRVEVPLTLGHPGFQVSAAVFDRRGGHRWWEAKMIREPLWTVAHVSC